MCVALLINCTALESLLGSRPMAQLTGTQSLDFPPKSFTYPSLNTQTALLSHPTADNPHGRENPVLTQSTQLSMQMTDWMLKVHMHLFPSIRPGGLRPTAPHSQPQLCANPQINPQISSPHNHTSTQLLQLMPLPFTTASRSPVNAAGVHVDNAQWLLPTPRGQS